MAQRASEPRRGAYRRHTGLPLGLRLAPPFACALSGEMVHFLTAIGVHCTMYCDDLLIAARSDEKCSRDMDDASAFFSWLGFKCNPEKTRGPCHLSPVRRLGHRHREGNHLHQ